MKKILTAASVLSLLAVAPASAGFYGSVAAGSNLQSSFESFLLPEKEKTNPGLAASLAVGYEISSLWGIRAEAEALYLSSGMKDIDNANLNSQGGFVNAYVPLLLGFYVGGGIGAMQTQLHDTDYNVGEGLGVGFAYQGIIGWEIGVPVINKIGIEARYVASKGTILNDETYETKNWLLMAKVQF